MGFHVVDRQIRHVGDDLDEEVGLRRIGLSWLLAAAAGARG